MDQSRTDDGYITFFISEQEFAIPVSRCIRVVPIVEIKTLPLAPKHVRGTINYQGEIIPVLNLRKMFLMKSRQISLDDHLLIAQANQLKLALWVDSPGRVIGEEAINFTEKSRIMHDGAYLEGLIKTEDGTVVISDIDRFLNDTEVKKLEQAIRKQKLSISTGKKTIKKKADQSI